MYPYEVTVVNQLTENVRTILLSAPDDWHARTEAEERLRSNERIVTIRRVK